MNIKHILAIGLGIITLQASAFVSVYKIQPVIDVKLVHLDKDIPNLQITIKEIEEFKGDTFRISFSLDGMTATVSGTSYRVRNYWGDLKRDKYGHKYRRRFFETIKLPAAVAPKLRGKTFAYNNRLSKDPYFSYYYHGSDSKVKITVPLED